METAFLHSSFISDESPWEEVDPGRYANEDCNQILPWKKKECEVRREKSQNLLRARKEFESKNGDLLASNKALRIQLGIPEPGDLEDPVEEKELSKEQLLKWGGIGFGVLFFAAILFKISTKNK